jgi:hypothetical protein
MSDHERLVDSSGKPLPGPKSEPTSKNAGEDASTSSSCQRARDRDDLVGLQANMLGKLEGRMLVILWLVFLFLHTEMFADAVLKPISGATNSSGAMSEKGTLYASVFMVLAIIACVLIFM